MGNGYDVLVTGGAGYIGSVLVPMLLGHGYDVTVVDNLIYKNGHALRGVWGHPRFNFIQSDIRDCTNVGWQYGHVIHLAAIVGETACQNHPDVAVRVNRDLAIGFAEIAKMSGSKTFIFASTCSNYGKVEEGELATEYTPLAPMSLYAETKVGAEKGILPLGSNDFRVIVLRFATAYGTSPRMRFDTLLNEFAMRAVVDKRLEVRNPQAWRPLCHVRDLAYAVLLSLNNKCMEGVYNVGGDNVRKIGLANALTGMTGVEIVCSHDDPDKRDYQVAFSKIHDDGFRCITANVWDGLREVIGAITNGLYENPASKEYRNE